MGVKHFILFIGALGIVAIQACSSTTGSIPANSVTENGRTINANIASFCEGASYFTAQGFSIENCKQLVDSAFDTDKSKWVKTCEKDYGGYLPTLCSVSASPCYATCDALWEGIVNGVCTEKCVK